MASLDSNSSNLSRMHLVNHSNQEVRWRSYSIASCYTVSDHIPPHPRAQALALASALSNSSQQQAASLAKLATRNQHQEASPSALSSNSSPQQVSLEQLPSQLPRSAAALGRRPTLDRPSHSEAPTTMRSSNNSRLPSEALRLPPATPLAQSLPLAVSSEARVSLPLVVVSLASNRNSSSRLEAASLEEQALQVPLLRSRREAPTHPTRLAWSRTRTQTAT